MFGKQVTHRYLAMAFNFSVQTIITGLTRAEFANAPMYITHRQIQQHTQSESSAIRLWTLGRPINYKKFNKEEGDDLADTASETLATNTRLRGAMCRPETALVPGRELSPSRRREDASSDIAPLSKEGRVPLVFFLFLYFFRVKKKRTGGLFLPSRNLGFLV